MFPFEILIKYNNLNYYIQFYLLYEISVKIYEMLVILISLSRYLRWYIC